MVDCAFCHQRIERMPFKCRRCGQEFCPKHRLPEDHKCPNLKRGNVYNNLSNKRSHRRKAHSHKFSPSKPVKRQTPLKYKLKNFYIKNMRSFGKWIPVVGIVLLFALSHDSDQSTNPTPLKEKITDVLGGFGDSFIVGSFEQLLVTIILCITIWTGYKYWLLKYKPIRRNNKLLKKLVIVSIITIILGTHIKANSVLGKYVDWGLFLMFLYLILAGSWFLAKTIDRINLRSDLYCWGLRIVGGIIIIFGIVMLMSSSISMTLSSTNLVSENLGWILSVCLILLGLFMQYRSTRRHPAIMVWH